MKSLYQHEQISYSEAKELLTNISKGKLNNSQIASFLTIFIMRGISTEELVGFRDALLEMCTKVDLSDYNTIDLCGTGGDAKDTFNISTLASFVVAGAGINVAKHGNYGVSSVSGSSNVLEYLGYTFKTNQDDLKKELDTAGICFMHAPLFHPAMKNVAPIRKELGVKTFFNMLGPMVNPSFPKNQLVGVFNLELARTYQYIYQQSFKKFTIVHSLDGYDEVSLTAPTKLISNTLDTEIDAEYFGMKQNTQEDIYGGISIKTSAKKFLDIIQNKGTKAQKNVVIANAALAIQCVTQKPIEESVNIAKESLKSGKAYLSLKNLITK